MACYNFWDTARLNFGTTSIQHFLADFFLIQSHFDIANFSYDKTPCSFAKYVADDSTPYISAKNVEDVIEPLERASVYLFRWFENNLLKVMLINAIFCKH